MADTAIIIGGGIAGCSSAYALAQRGIKVTLLERNADIASAASGNPLAMLYPRLSGDDASSQFALAGYMHSLAIYRTLQLEAGQIDNCGMLQLGFNPRELARIKKVAAQNHVPEIIRYVTSIEASAIAGITLEHDALFLPDAAWVRPQRLCQRLIQHQNITLKRACSVTAIQKDNHRFKVQNNGKTVAEADIVIIANANDAEQLCPGLPLSTQAVRGQVSLLKSSENSRQLKSIVCSDGYLSPAAYPQSGEHLQSEVHPQSEVQLHCLGATFAAEAALPETGEPPLKDEDHEANLQKLKRISAQLYHELHGGIAGGRVSYRCATSDYMPLAGQLIDTAALKAHPPRAGAPAQTLPWVSGLYMNVAHGSKGFTTAPLCAELLACMICNEPLPVSAELAGLLNPNRFLLREMGLKRLAKLTASRY